MAKKRLTKDPAPAPRRRAERKLHEAHLPMATPHPEPEVRRLVHELEVYHVELEQQNDELRAARDSAEALLEKFTDLYDFAPVGYFTLSAEATISQVNLTGATLLGIARTRLVGKSFASLISPAHRKVFQNFIREISEEGIKHSIESEFLIKGRPELLVNIEVQRSSCGRECRVAVMDITQRRQVEDALRISELRYRRLFEAAHDGVLLLDPATSKIIDANPFMTALLGYSRADLVGRELFEIGLLEDEQASREMMQKLKTQHEIRYENLPLESKEGRHQEVEVVANLYQADGHSFIQCNVRDIRVRKLAEDILQRNEMLFSTLVDQSPIGIYVVNRKFCMQQVNPVAMHVFSKFQPLIGRNFSEINHALWPKRVAKEIDALFRHTLKTGEAYYSPGFHETRRDLKQTEIYEWQIQRVVLPAGEYGVVCYFSDITERTKAAATQRRMELLSASNEIFKEEIARRKVVEANLKAARETQSVLLKQSKKQQLKLRELSHRILTAQEQERKRISRELHDIIAQTLVGVNVHLTALCQSTTMEESPALEHIFRTRELVSKAVDTIHHFARELRPAMLDNLGLLPALRVFLENFMETTGVRTSLASFPAIEGLPSLVKTTLFRICQEALTNVARHAKATSVTINIMLVDEFLHLEIKDDGQGFAMDSKATAAKNARRIGLLGMKERVEMINGEFRLESTPGKFTCVYVKIPLAHPA